MNEPMPPGLAIFNFRRSLLPPHIQRALLSIVIAERRYDELRAALCLPHDWRDGWA